MHATTDKTAGYAPVSGINLYYELHGGGKPLVLPHGGLVSIDSFGEVLPALAQGRQVIAVDLQGHGRTADVDRPIRYGTMADDIAALTKHLALDTPDVMGYSLGGGVAVRLAIQHPELVDGLVLVSAPCKRDGWYPEIRNGMASVSAAMAEEMKATPMYETYSAIAPRVEDWPMLLDKMGEALGRDYDWFSDVASMKAPTLLVVGDSDAVRTAHAVEFFELLGGGKQDAGWDGAGMASSRLAILPGETHYGIYSSPALASTVVSFLDSPVTAQ